MKIKSLSKPIAAILLFAAIGQYPRKCHALDSFSQAICSIPLAVGSEKLTPYLKIKAKTANQLYLYLIGTCKANGKLNCFAKMSDEETERMINNLGEISSLDINSDVSSILLFFRLSPEKRIEFIEQLKNYSDKLSKYSTASCCAYYLGLFSSSIGRIKKSDSSYSNPLGKDFYSYYFCPISFLISILICKFLGWIIESMPHPKSITAENFRLIAKEFEKASMSEQDDDSTERLT